MKKLLLSLLSLFCMFGYANAQQGTALIKVTDIASIKQIGGTSLSHNGKWVVYTVTAILPDEENKNEYVYRSQLWLASTDGKTEPRAITTLSAGASQASWSADDSQLVFTRVVKGKPQLFLMNLDGGEPVQLTNSSYGASSPIWSPDGKQIVYSVGLGYKELLKDSVINPSLKAPLWPLEKPGFIQNPQPGKEKPNADGSVAEIRLFLNQDEADHKVKVFNKLNFEGEATTNPEFGFNHYFIIDAKPGAKPIRLTGGFNNYGAAQFTPDGKSIMVTASSDTLLNPDRSLSSSIYRIPVTGGKPVSVFEVEGYELSNGPVSPSGKYMVYQKSKDLDIVVPELGIIDLADPSKKMIIPFDRNASGFTWSKDGKFLYFTAQSNGGIPIYRVNMENLKPEQLSSFDEGMSSLAVGKTQIVYVKTAVADPFELYVADLENKNAKRLTSLNYEWLKDKKLSFPEKKYYTNTKGEKVEYWVMKPTNFDPAKKYPVMLQIHGGPTAMWGPGEATMWHEFQYFCAQGYGVVYSNPRGSGGYGSDFLKANYKDWGTGPSEDVLAALDGAIAEGWADKTKQFATGGSYAGYLTAWLEGHTTRFAAISSQRGVYELSTFFGEANAWRLVPEYFGGYPWEEKTRALLLEESPFTYVANMTTPYLIIHGETDLRTGIVQGEMLYKALKVMNRPVEYVQHPGGTHELVRSGNVRQRIDQMLRIYEFFERYNN
jgi:dipeptidyl aminopeptidase/acylaminoacyl peptidase